MAAAEPGEEQAPEVPVKGLRSVSSIAYQKGASIATVDNVMTRYPLPPKKGAKKEEKKAPWARTQPAKDQKQLPLKCKRCWDRPRVSGKAALRQQWS